MVDVGTQISHYKVVEHIGRGGMADVWSARDSRLNRMVAIKTIVHGLNDGGQSPLSMFRQEAQTIAQMEHPHILPIYDFGEFEGKLYIVMRYVTGGSLGDRLERGALPISEAIRLGRAVAQALDYAHANNVIHLDLKPQNVLLDSYQSPYLADFGLATRLDPDGRALNPGSGTLLYMAPEQLVSDTLDRRADIYSFALMMYHLLTGDLPFNGSMPLALKQLQFDEHLPDLKDYPAQVSQILRRGTAQEADDRPRQTVDIIDEMEAVLSDSVSLPGVALSQPGDGFTGVIFDAGIVTDDANLREAIELYSRAHHAWAGGQGKFLPGVTHFMLMNDYYMHADRHGLTLDLEGRQLFLRGALEYDRDIDYWWQQLDTPNRRWVCLHAIRSESAPARVRAFYRLETMPDAETQRIPRLVAQALQLETNEQAQIAALNVLATRARLMKPAEKYEIQTSYRGLMLSTLTRVELQVRRDVEWYEQVYTPEIDRLLAEVALDDDNTPAVRELAARVVGRIRSTAAVRYLVEQQQARRDGAWRALALVRDEAPSLPPVVNRRAKAYAWLVNTWRRISDQPLALTWRFLLAVLGGALGMGALVYITFRAQAIFDPQRVANAYSFGLAFGAMIGVLTLIAEEIPSRLRGFWLWWARLAFSAGLGFVWGTLCWAMVSYMYLQQAVINWPLMALGGLGLSLGLTLATLLNLRGWLATLITAVSAYLPIYATWNHICEVYFMCPDAPRFSLSPAIGIGLLVGLFAGQLLRLQNPQNRTLPLDHLPGWGRAAVGVVAGAGVVIAAWLAFAWALNVAGSINWDGVVGLVLLGIAAGIGVFWLPATARAGYALSSVAVYSAFMLTLTPTLQGLDYRPPFGGAVIDFLFFFDNNDHVFTAAVPLALFTALGMFALPLSRDLRKLRARQGGVDTPAPAQLPTLPLIPDPVDAAHDPGQRIVHDLHTARVNVAFRTETPDDRTAILPDLKTEALPGDRTAILPGKPALPTDNLPDLKTEALPGDRTAILPGKPALPTDSLPDLKTEALPPRKPPTDRVLRDDDGDEIARLRDADQ